MRLSFRIFLGGAVVLGGLVSAASAQGIAAEMARQRAYWTPERQRMAVMGDGSDSVASVPAMSPAFQRQLQLQQQQVQLQQQMQQLRLATAQMVGQQIGQMLADSLFGSKSSQAAAQSAAAARQAAILQQQQIAAARQARIEHAAALRMDWDQRDTQMAADLADVFNAPVSGSSALFGSNGPDAASVQAELASDSRSLVVPLDMSVPLTSLATPTASSDPSVVVLDDDKPLALAPEFLAAQQQRAAQTMAFNDSLSPWAQTPAAAAPVPGAALYDRNTLAEKVNGFAVDQAVDHLAEAAQRLPGLGWVGRAKSVYDYADALHGQYEALRHPFQTENDRTLALFMRGMTEATDQLASPNRGGQEFAETYFAEIQRQGGRYGDMAQSLIEKQIHWGLSGSTRHDVEIMSGSDEPSRVRAVRGEPNAYVRFNIWQQQGGANLTEIGYP